MALRLGVSLVSMNRPHILRRTLDALEPTLPTYAFGVIVDNGSTDPETLRILDEQEKKPRWNVLRNDHNRGLSVAVNQGLSWYAFDSAVLVHMDDDALISGSPDWVRVVLDTFEGCPELGLVIPNTYTEVLPHSRYDEVRWGLGMFWCLRRETYDRIGGYDPQLLHQNECDLCLRVRMAGYTVGSVASVNVIHNDPGGPRSDLSLAREHLGVVQFRDKWAGYFRGADWNYGTTPLYLMQHWPPDQEWYRRFALHHGLDLNPPPPDVNTSPGATLTPSEQTPTDRRIKVGHGQYMIYHELRNDYAHWERGEGYLIDRQKAIDRWKALTNEEYAGYKWPVNPLHCA